MAPGDVPQRVAIAPDTSLSLGNSFDSSMKRTLSLPVQDDLNFLSTV